MYIRCQSVIDIQKYNFVDLNVTSKLIYFGLNNKSTQNPFFSVTQSNYDKDNTSILFLCIIILYYF